MSGPSGAAVPGNPKVNVTVQAGNYTILPTDYLIVATGTTPTITLPASPGTGQQHVIKNRSAGLVNIAGTVDGVASPTIAAGANMYVFWSGTEWVNGT